MMVDGGWYLADEVLCALGDGVPVRCRELKTTRLDLPEQYLVVAAVAAVAAVAVAAAAAAAVAVAAVVALVAGWRRLW